MPPPVALVVAVARNGIIGRGGALPWRLRSDLKRFKALTIGKPMVMGRKTFAAIGKALPGRTTVVVTRQPDFRPADVEVAHSWPEALRRAQAVAASSGADEIAVIGGGELFTEALPDADRVYLTEVDATPEGDAFFPPLDPAEWREVRREAHPAGPADEHAFAFVDYARRRRVRVAAPHGVA
ncbi:MAG TPA: dihydrofolate reductase [Hyphomicrobiales bacterium]|nr:dihydrofolate reductase [Hyphomicrobiales bacterium]